MILPCIIGHFLWSEKLTVISVLGVLLAILAIVLLKGGNEKNKKFNLKGIGFGVIIFLTSAGVMIAQKIMGIYFAEQSISAYNLFSFVIPFLILCCFLDLNSFPVEKKEITPSSLSVRLEALYLFV
jgi:drug/metabolite transporter (DMT)-like permease